MADIDLEITDSEAREAARRVTEGRCVAENAYRNLHEQLGSDAPTLPDCLADDMSSDEEEGTEDDAEDDDDDEEDTEEEEDDDDDGFGTDTDSDLDGDHSMDLDNVIPPIAVE